VPPVLRLVYALFLVGLVGWFIVGVLWNDRAIMLIHLVALFALLAGLLAWGAVLRRKCGIVEVIGGIQHEKEKVVFFNSHF